MLQVKHILIVDDEPGLVKGLRLSLEHEGFRVSAAASGREALDKAAAGDFDLILLDLMLPEVDGLTVCRELRQKCRTPIIMLTARADDVDKILGLEFGADDYVTKPFSSRELIARIRALLRRVELDGQPNPGHRLTLGNLVENSLKYTQRGGRVTVAVSAPDGLDAASVTVADNGPGIAPEHLPRIFERFYRVDKARSRATGGAGLGLAIAAEAAALLGGRIDAASEVGRGSRFTLVLPRDADTGLNRSVILS